MSAPDPYKILQVDPEAEDEVIEAAYKRLARKYHPDVSRDPDSVERMVMINQAREMLRNPVRRAAVDRARTRAAATSARVTAADAREQVVTGQGQPQRASSTAASTGVPPAPTQWPIPGMVDPSTGSYQARPERASPDPTPARSTTGSHYDAGTTGSGAAGPPPGNPSGSLVTFGRYDGWTLGEIARTNIDYLEWLDRMPIGRTYQSEIDALLRKAGLRVTAVDPASSRPKGLFRRR